jgi:uncharacterized membrane protein YfcA
MWIAALLLGLGIGILVGLMGIGGGVVMVPAMVYLLGMEQHLAQGTSLFLQLPPLGLGALYAYWKKGHVELAGGLACAGGLLAGNYFGGFLAVRIPAQQLRGMFGGFLMLSALLLWFKGPGLHDPMATDV